MSGMPERIWAGRFLTTERCPKCKKLTRYEIESYDETIPGAEDQDDKGAIYIRADIAAELYEALQLALDDSRNAMQSVDQAWDGCECGGDTGDPNWEQCDMCGAMKFLREILYSKRPDEAKTPKPLLEVEG